MEYANLSEKMKEADAEKREMTRLFNADTMRSWILYFEPDDSTDMHYHNSPESFLVLEGSAAVRGLKGEERSLEKNEVVFINAKEYYQIRNVGPGPLILFGNRSEAFGGPHVSATEGK
jgi:mannose-6-phosphate isomerase-like protein (cupin superfamily)